MGRELTVLELVRVLLIGLQYASVESSLPGAVELNASYVKCVLCFLCKVMIHQSDIPRATSAHDI